MGKIKSCLKNIIQAMYRIVNNKPEPPSLELDKLFQIDREILNFMLPESVKHVHISQTEFDEFERKFSFKEFYDEQWPRYQRKICEYLIVDKILHFSDKQDESYFYIDAMSSSSKWASDLKQKYGIKAYSVDINSPSNATECFIKANVTKLPFEDESIDAISVQSGIELLPGEDDIKFMKEVQRVLKPKGKCIILPLYLNPEFCNLYGRSYYKEQTEKDEGAIDYIRLDYDIPFTRLYDLINLKKRLLSITDEGSCWSIYIIDSDDSINLIDKRDSFIYLRYVLMYEKK